MKKMILAICILMSTISLGDSDFDKTFKMIISNEGTTYVHNKKIKEKSKFGITLKTIRGVGYDVNYDGWINEYDVKALTLSKAKRFYMRYYYTPVKELKYIDGKYAMNIYRQVLDTGVGLGVGTSVRMLQKSINDYVRIQKKRGRRGFEYVDVDGIIGDETLGMLERCKLSNINNSVVDYRIAKYEWLVRKNPKAYQDYERGWINRAKRFRIK